MNIEIIENTLEQLSHRIPVEIFIFLGSILEEIIAPIPSPFISVIAGSIASAKAYPFIALLLLASIGAIGKVIGSLVIYKIADISEDIVLSKFGKLLGLSHHAVEQLGTKFHKGGRDWLILTSLRAIPIIPSGPISVVCGLIKMPLTTFIGASLIGNSIRNFIFIYFGYTGITAYKEIIQGMDTMETFIKIISLGLIGISMIWIFYHRRKKQN